MMFFLCRSHICCVCCKMHICNLLLLVFKHPKTEVAHRAILGPWAYSYCHIYVGSRSRSHEVCAYRMTASSFADAAPPMTEIPSRPRCRICRHRPGRRRVCSVCGIMVGPCCYDEGSQRCIRCHEAEPEPEPEVRSSSMITAWRVLRGASRHGSRSACLLDCLKLTLPPEATT